MISHIAIYRVGVSW